MLRRNRLEPAFFTAIFHHIHLDFDTISTFYNEFRLRGALGYLSPDQYRHSMSINMLSNSVLPNQNIRVF